MKGAVSNLLLLQAFLLSACRVWAIHHPVLSDEQVPSNANSRIVETLRVARQLRDSNRKLLQCSESLPAIQQALGSGSGTSCECVDIEGTDSSLVNCLDFCELCQPDLGLCVSYEYAFNFVQGNLSTFLGRLRYTQGRTDELEFQETYSGNGVGLSACSTSVNGVQCNSCSASPEGCEGGDAVLYDCSNIEAGAVFDECLGDFESIPETSVFVAYNTNFFNDADCIFFPTASPMPTETPFPTTPPKGKTQSPTSEAMATTMPPTRPPLITIKLNPFQIGVEFQAINGIEFDEAILNYLTTELNRFFPELAGVVLNRIQPDGAIPAFEATFEYEGEAVFLGGAPLALALEAAQRYILRDLVSLQEAITSNPDVGEDVFVVAVLIDADTLPPTPSPTMAPIAAKGKPVVKPKNPWYFRPKKSSKMGGKGGKMKGSKKASKKNMDKNSVSYYHPVPSPTYKMAMVNAMTMSNGNYPPAPTRPVMSWKYNMPMHDNGGTKMGSSKALMYGTWSMSQSNGMKASTGTTSSGGGNAWSMNNQGSIRNSNGLSYGGVWSNPRSHSSSSNNGSSSAKGNFSLTVNSSNNSSSSSNNKKKYGSWTWWQMMQSGQTMSNMNMWNGNSWKMGAMMYSYYPPGYWTRKKSGKNTKSAKKMKSGKW